MPGPGHKTALGQKMGRSFGSHGRRAYGTLFVVITLALGAVSHSARAQSYIWRGAGSTTATTDYNLSTNWSNPPAGAPPVVLGQSAVFSSTGSTAINVSAGPIFPSAWTFDANAQSYAVTGGSVSFGGAGITNNANAGQTISIANNLAGFGALVQQVGNSTLTLSGTNTYAGLTIVQAGTLIVSGSIKSAASVSGGTFTSTGTIGSIVITGGTANLQGAINGLVNNGGLGVLNVTGDLTSNSIFLNTGVAQLKVSGGNFTGITTLTNNSNSVDGGIIISTGRTLSANAIINPAGAEIINNGTLSTGIGLGNSGTFINNAGGKVTGYLSSNDGAVTNNGALNGDAGIFGGTFAGTGTVTNLGIYGGTFAPGSATPGTSMTVTGNLAFQSGALYLVQLNPTASTFTSVTGTASLGGATVSAVYANGNYVSKRYTIVDAAGGVSGTFNSLVNTNLPANFSSSLTYDATHAYLNLAFNFVPPPNSGLSVNQQNVANAIVGFFNSNGIIPLVFGSLSPAGLTQISGEVATGAQRATFDAMGVFMGIMTDPFVSGRGNPIGVNAGATPYSDEERGNAYTANDRARSNSDRDAYAAVYRKAPLAPVVEQRWSVWAAGYGGSQTTGGNAALGSNNSRSSIGGVVVGADYRFSPNTLAGFAIAGGGTSFSVDGSGSGHSDLFQAGVFARHDNGSGYLSATLAYGWQDISTDRTVTIAGTDLLHANFSANAWSGRLEGGYRFVAPWTGGVGITPYAAARFVTFDLPAYAERALSGANTFALNYAGKSVTDPRTELGLRTDRSFAVQNGILTLRGLVAWAHDYNNTDRSVTPTFQSLPGAPFIVNGAARAPDSVLLTTSAEMKWLNGFSLSGTFEGEFSEVTTSYAGKAVARYAW